METRRKHHVYRIKVRTKAATPTKPEVVEYGRPGGGAGPYEYLTRDHADAAARMWGDAYTRGDVWVVREVR